MTIKNPTPDKILGAVLAFVSDYRENVENKDIQEVEVTKDGMGLFYVKLWFPINNSESDFESLIIEPNDSLQDIRELTEATLDSIYPFVQPVNV